jgi:hypothetical protein
MEREPAEMRQPVAGVTRSLRGVRSMLPAIPRSVMEVNSRLTDRSAILSQMRSILFPMAEMVTEIRGFLSNLR